MCLPWVFTANVTCYVAPAQVRMLSLRSEITGEVGQARCPAPYWVSGTVDLIQNTLHLFPNL
ncbi:hypothetical protein E2C01_080708 [Portunus trituberculatus]|uniref:Uncharacterized protein n=1 Tax=Portunus trituberculatus TaxID=210409 RepID=A0A5B7IWT9_PORTR|nr:hypothetical protein [Portunus trituberculatus]